MSDAHEATPAPRPRKALRVFRGSVVVIYWVALPLAVLGALGGAAGLMFGPGQPVLQWPLTLGFAAFAVVLAWRLWLNSRALGWAGPVPRARRLLTVLLPLGILALVGLVIAAVGLVWLITGGLMLLAPENSTMTFRELVMSKGLVLGCGLAAALLGVALTLPMIRVLRARPASAANG